MNSYAMLRYALPYPPSTNGLFFNKAKGRGTTDAYRAWKKAAGEQILVQGRKHLLGPVSLSIALVRPDNRRRDLDNTLKAVLDLLGTKHGMGVIEDDSCIQRISIQWIPSGDPCTVLIHQAESELAA